MLDVVVVGARLELALLDLFDREGDDLDVLEGLVAQVAHRLRLLGPKREVGALLRRLRRRAQPTRCCLRVEIKFPGSTPHARLDGIT